MEDGSSSRRRLQEPIYAEPTKCPRVMTPVMLRAKSASSRAVTGGGGVSDDEEGALTAVETSTPNRHTLASSGVGGAGHGVQRTFVGHSNGAAEPTATSGSSSSSSIQSRRYHSKSLSLSEGKTLAKAFETPSLRLCTFSGSSQLFQQNRSLWEKRTGELEAGGSSAGDRSSRNAAPDLVLDLPAASSVCSSSSNSENSLIAEGGCVAAEGVGPASPDATEEGGSGNGSGADCFAHNQYTLKKNDKFLLQESSRHHLATAQDNNNSQEEPEQGDQLHISEDDGGQPPAETVIAERNTHKFIAQFADLKLTGGSLPVKGGAGQTTAAAAAVELGPSATDSTSSSTSSLFGIAFRPILRREKPQILRKPVLGTSSGPPSLTGGGGNAGMMSFGAKGSGGSADGEAGAKSLE